MSLDLFALAARRIDYLSTRDQVLTQNVANVATPGFRARDVKPFEAVLDHTALTIKVTNPAHLTASGTAAAAQARATPDWETSLSGNTVTVEAELAKVGEVQRGYSLATSVLRGFQRMALANVKG